MKRIAPVVLALALLAGGCAGGAMGPELPPLASKVRDLRDKGHHALARGDAAQAGLIFDDARRLAESLDDRPGLAGALNDLGAVAALQGAYPKAAELHRRAHGIALEIGDQTLAVEGLSYRGQTAHLMGDHAAAL
ncbi:MAG: tetratricopeptide repeat protein, partial [Nitrospirota bacterium]